MKNIMEGLSSVRFEDSDDLDPASSFSILKKYYAENSRHRYSEISKVVYGFTDDRIDILRINLNAIIELAIQKEEGELVEKVKKLIDHADLAEYQRKMIEDVVKESKVLIVGHSNLLERSQDKLMVTKEKLQKTEVELQDTIKKIEDANHELRKTKDQLNEKYDSVSDDIDELKLEKTSVYTQFVTILGIFTTIIFASFGGLEIFKNILGNIVEVSTPKLLLFSSISVGAIITVLFILLAGISKLTGKSLSSCRCTDVERKTCTHSIYTKHPSIAIIGFFMFYIALIGAYGYIIDFREILDIYKLKYLFGSGLKVSFIVLLIFSPILFFLVFNYRRRQDQESDKTKMLNQHNI